MPTNLIRTGAASPGAPGSSTLPFQAAGPSQGSFANTLQSARLAEPIKAQPVPAPLVLRKSTVSRAAENSKATTAAQVLPTIATGVVPNQTLPPAPVVPADIVASLATANAVQPEASTRKLAALLEPDSFPAGSVAAVSPAGKQTPTSGPVLQPNLTAESVRQVNPLPSDKPEYRLARNESEAGQLRLGPSVASFPTGASVAAAPVKSLIAAAETAKLPSSCFDPVPAETATTEGSIDATKAAASAGINQVSPANNQQSNGSDLRAAAPVSPSIAARFDLAAAAGNTVNAPAPATSAPATAAPKGNNPQTSKDDPRAFPSSPLPPGAGLEAADATREPANAAAGVKPALGSEARAGGVDDRTLAPTFLSPADATDPAEETGNPTAVANETTPGGKPQPGDGGPLPLTATPLPTAAPNAIDPTGSLSGAIASSGQSVSGAVSGAVAGAVVGAVAGAVSAVVSVNESPSGSVSASKGPAAVVSRFNIPNPTSLSGIPKPSVSHAATPIKDADPVSPSTAPEKEMPSPRASSTAEHPTAKVVDAAPVPPEANAPPISPTAVSSAPAAQANGGGPGSPAVIASVPTPVSVAPASEVGGRNSTPPAAANLQPPAASSAAPSSVAVESARLVAGVSQSEMHLGVSTQAFGNVEVHTVVRDSQVGLTVGSERGDLRTLLAPEVSGLQTTFRQQELRFDNIRYLETSAGTTGGFSGGSDSQARSSNQQAFSPGGSFSVHGPPEDAAESETGDRLPTGLNVLA